MNMATLEEVRDGRTGRGGRTDAPRGPLARVKEEFMASISERSNLSLGLILGVAGLVLTLMGGSVAYLVSGAREAGVNATTISNLADNVREFRGELANLRAEVRGELTSLRQEVMALKGANGVGK